MDLVDEIKVSSNSILQKSGGNIAQNIKFFKTSAKTGGPPSFYYTGGKNSFITSPKD